ncbi:MAG: hypothetical protein AAFW68_06025 [Pseudomonadota bacterium]
MQEPAPTDPYNPEYLLEGVEADASPVTFIKAHPIASGFTALMIVVFVVWYVRRSRKT